VLSDLLAAFREAVKAFRAYRARRIRRQAIRDPFTS
jgi:hypothetical protein